MELLRPQMLLSETILNGVGKQLNAYGTPPADDSFREPSRRGAAEDYDGRVRLFKAAGNGKMQFVLFPASPVPWRMDGIVK